MAGISVRTLHYYDQIGLLRPSFSATNGYRYYTENELLKLQQILFFRELEFSLEQINEMMNLPTFVPQSPEIQEMVSQHYNGLRTFYEPNFEMYKGLGQLYVDDPRFTTYYDRFGEGLAVFLRDAMLIFIERNAK